MSDPSGATNGDWDREDDPPMRNVCKGGFPRPHCPQWCDDGSECRFAHPTPDPDPWAPPAPDKEIPF